MKDVLIGVVRNEVNFVRRHSLSDELVPVPFGDHGDRARAAIHDPLQAVNGSEECAAPEHTRGFHTLGPYVVDAVDERNATDPTQEAGSEP